MERRKKKKILALHLAHTASCTSWQHPCPTGVTAFCQAHNYTVSFLFDFLLAVLSASDVSCCGEIRGLFSSVARNCVVLAYQAQLCSTKPLNLEIRPFTLVLPGFPCQIFIEAETLYGHPQADGHGHKQASKQQKGHFTDRALKPIHF